MTTNQRIAELPRGIRNNNPGNIRAVDTYTWQHACGHDGDGYLIFDKPEWGIRAGCIIWHNYQFYHGIQTIQGAIRRWAPPPENPTDKYAQYVSYAIGVSMMEPIDFCNYAIPLIKAIIHVENGQQPYSYETIAKGLALANRR